VVVANDRNNAIHQLDLSKLLSFKYFGDSESTATYLDYNEFLIDNIFATGNKGALS
jgi:hypothetical protein